MLTAHANRAGSTTVGFSYDNGARRSTLTLSNGVNVSYSYDNDSRVTGISYKGWTARQADIIYRLYVKALSNEAL